MISVLVIIWLYNRGSFLSDLTTSTDWITRRQLTEISQPFHTLVIPSPTTHTHTPHSIPDGELIERIIEEDDLTEGVVVGYIAQLLSALECIHNMDIAHLDIKVGQRYYL